MGARPPLEQSQQLEDDDDHDDHSDDVEDAIHGGTPIRKACANGRVGRRAKRQTGLPGEEDPGGHFAEVEISALLTARMHATPPLSASFWSPADALGAAGLAQLVEQLICNHQVTSSSLVAGSIGNQ
jgi:hypothetical protein